MSVYLIAEVGTTHDGSLGNALALVDALSVGEYPVNAVKFQDHFADISSLDSPAPCPRGFLAPVESRREYLERVSAWGAREWRALRDAARRRKIDYVVSPFSVAAAERQWQWCEPDRWKVASGQATNLAMLAFLGGTGRPVILSAGLVTADERQVADDALRAAGCTDIAWLCCTSEYPCPPEHARYQEWRYFDGLSDHTRGKWAPIAAVARGARILEKHVTLDTRMYGSDAWHSMSVEEFRALCEELAALEVAMTSGMRGWIPTGARERYLYREPGT